MWDVKNLVQNGKNMDKLPTSTGERQISEPSTVGITHQHATFRGRQIGSFNALHIAGRVATLFLRPPVVNPMFRLWKNPWSPMKKTVEKSMKITVAWELQAKLSLQTKIEAILVLFICLHGVMWGKILNLCHIKTLSILSTQDCCLKGCCWYWWHFLKLAHLNVIQF